VFSQSLQAVAGMVPGLGRSFSSKSVPIHQSCNHSMPYSLCNGGLCINDSLFSVRYELDVIKRCFEEFQTSSSDYSAVRVGPCTGAAWQLD
jgi:hypothetical protein